MNIKSIEDLKTQKLRLEYERELAELEVKVRLESLKKYNKPANLIETAIVALPFKNARTVASVAALVFKMFVKKGDKK
ncbi:MAG: hypothetical protein K0U33_04745 [Bacteroidetes bacterium]|jgi:hypothetical protein|nr:hypothetical protein [Crocinitomicaceae bacterium]MCH9822643.1 hypothetical protein [Bacteroidota bacterium]|tara:strand:- start:1990 stop:2223 length:234 start_codon:yes stop_codon:yes gene_type:complete